MADFNITGPNQFGGARMIEDQPQLQELMVPQQQAPPPLQQTAGGVTLGIDPAVAAKLFAPVEEVPYGY